MNAEKCRQELSKRNSQVGADADRHSDCFVADGEADKVVWNRRASMDVIDHFFSELSDAENAGAGGGYLSDDDGSVVSLSLDDDDEQDGDSWSSEDEFEDITDELDEGQLTRFLTMGTDDLKARCMHADSKFFALSADSPLHPAVFAVKSDSVVFADEVDGLRDEDECPFLEEARLSAGCRMKIGLPGVPGGGWKDPREVHPALRSYREWEEYKRLEREQRKL
jgi:hypothetical protein